MIRNFYLLLLLIAFSSCSSLGVTRSFSYLDGYFRGFESDQISKTDYQESEYSFANVKIGRGPAAKVILAYVREDVFEWRSADGIVLFTQNGQIIKTQGLPHDISIESIPFKSDDIYKVNTLSTFKNPPLVQALTLNEIFSLPDSFLLNRADGAYEASVYKVKKNIPSIKWNSKNRYYLDKQMRVIYSEQFLHPFMPIIRIEYYYK